MSRAIAPTNQALDDNMLLGYLFFYTLGEIKISEQELEQVFTSNGLDPKYVRKINPVDAFRRATSSVKQTVNINYNGTIKKAKLEVDEVVCDNDQVVRVLGRKVVDDKNKTLSYETVGKVTFDRKNKSVFYDYHAFKWDSEYTYDSILKQTIIKYDDWSIYHTKETVRNMAGYVLNDMHPVNLMPSGMCKFIPKGHKDLLYSLQGAMRELSSYGDPCLFESVPVIDTDEMRGTVNKAAANEVEQEAKNFVLELNEILNNRQELSPRLVASYVEKAQSLKDKVIDYEKLLGSYMNFARQQVIELYQLVQQNKKEVG